MLLQQHYYTSTTNIESVENYVYELAVTSVYTMIIVK